MNRLKTIITNYLKKSSWFKILTDFLFYLFIILMIIPGTRRALSELIIRASLMRPIVKSENIKEFINPEDEKMIFQDFQRNNYKLEDFKGKIILINFWASWCPPCRAEMPVFQKLYDDYREKVSFIFVTDDQPDKVVKYMSEFNYHLPVYFLRSVPTQTFNIHSLPTTFVINRKGEIQVNKKGAANWNSKEFRERLDFMIKDEK